MSRRYIILQLRGAVVGRVSPPATLCVALRAGHAALFIARSETGPTFPPSASEGIQKNIYAAILTVLLVCPLLRSALAGPAENKAPAPITKNQPDNNQTLPDKLLRDPFWPIDWQPEKIQIKETSRKPEEPGKINKIDSASTLIKWDEALNQIQVIGISKKEKDDTCMAIIRVNMAVEVVEAGDIIPIDYENLTYRIKILTISGKGIAPERLDVRPAK